MTSRGDFKKSALFKKLYPKPKDVLPEDLAGIFKDLGFTVIEIPVDDSTVLCDLCNADYLHDDMKGGYMFLSKAVCPKCGPKFEESAKSYNEEKYIGERAKEGETFRDFVYRIREMRGER